MSIKQGVFPEKMKMAKVIPIFKKGSKLNVENYRPISLLPVFSKILERLVHNRLSDFLDECNVFYDRQFGFRSNHSTADATSYLASELYQALDDGEKAICVFMDLSKAFDTLNISILMQKLEHYGVRGLENNWFSSYLSGRTQFVEIEGHRSLNICEIKHGVPQGSILGPLLFNLYINDFWNCLTFGNAVMFADDTNIIFKSKNAYYLELMANDDILAASEWLNENKLSLNVNKTNFMYFDLSHNKRIPKLSIASNEINEVETQKFLGVIFDNKLNWKPHINSVISKLNSCLGATRRAQPFLNRDAFFTIYHSLMKSHIEYCCTTWASYKPRGNKVLLQRVQAVCNKYFRLAFNLERTASVKEILFNANILDVNQTYDFHAAQLMHKARAGNLPESLQNLFKIGIFRPCLFSVLPNRIAQTERSIYQSAPRVWNAISSEVTQETEFRKFKIELKKHLMNKN